MHYIEQIWQVLTGIAGNFTFKASFTAVITFYSFFFNFDFRMAMLALIALITFDLITGVVAAKISKEAIKSREGFLRTALKFGVYVMLVSTAHLADLITGYHLHLEFAMLSFLALTELISVIENAGKMGFAVPQRILNQVQEFRDGKKDSTKV